MTSQGPSLKDLFDRLGRQGAPGNAPRPGSSFVDRLATWSRRALVLLAVVAVVALVAAYWWFHPALNVQSPMVCTWIVGICLLGLLALAVAAARRPLRAKAYRRMMIVPVAPIAAIVIGGVLSLPLIPGNAERYASVLETTDGVFAEDIEEVDYSEVPVIDRDSAILLGNRAMGSIPEYVSQFEIADTYSMINYQGRPVRVSPLVYADLFKWLSNRDSGIPAYVLVDMVTQEAEVVRLEQPIRYSDSEPLARNVDRHAQLSYPDLMFDQKSFELDEEGHPWWATPCSVARSASLGARTSTGWCSWTPAPARRTSTPWRTARRGWTAPTPPTC